MSRFNNSEDTIDTPTAAHGHTMTRRLQDLLSIVCDKEVWTDQQASECDQKKGSMETLNQWGGSLLMWSKPPA